MFRGGDNQSSFVTAIPEGLVEPNLLQSEVRIHRPLLCLNYNNNMRVQLSFSMYVVIVVNIMGRGGGTAQLWGLTCFCLQ